MISPSEGLGILKKWEIQQSKLSLISRVDDPLGSLSTEVCVAVDESSLHLVPTSGASVMSLELAGVEFSSIRGPSRLALQLMFPSGGMLAFEKRLG